MSTKSTNSAAKKNDRGSARGERASQPRTPTSSKGGNKAGDRNVEPAVQVIKTPSKKAGADNSVASGRVKRPSANEKPGDKGILKKGGGQSAGSKAKDKPVKKVKPRKKTFFEKMAQNMGFYIGNVTLHDPRAIEAAQALGLKGWHLRRLRMRFDKIDIDGSGNIDYDEFFESVGEQRSPFSDKLFALIDIDGSGTIEFDEYVRVMATYCMFSKDEILRFAFECFDVDRSGTIDEKEFVELCKSINNAAPSFPGNFKRALEEFDVNEDGLIDYAEFVSLDKRYPIVLFPAFRLQDVMQRNSLGERTWLKVIEGYQESKRIEEYKASHGGKAPPDPPLKAIAKAFFPCFFREKVHIQVGAELEARHRSGN